MLEQQPGEIHWSICKTSKADSSREAAFCTLIRYKIDGSIVFQSYSTLHRFALLIPDISANKHVLAVLTKQAILRYRGESIKLATVVSWLEQAVRTSSWQAAAMS